jgi:hypothetical protein
MTRLELDGLERDGLVKKFLEAASRLVQARGVAHDDDVLERGHRADVSGDVLDVFLVHDKHARTGRLEDVGDAGPSGGVVDRHLNGADPEDAEPGAEELGSGRHHHRDPIALLDAQPAET